MPRTFHSIILTYIPSINSLSRTWLYPRLRNLALAGWLTAYQIATPRRHASTGPHDHLAVPHSIAAACHNNAAPPPGMTVGLQDTPVVPQTMAAAGYAAGPQNNPAALCEMMMQLAQHMG